MVANCNELEWPTAPGVSPASLPLLYILLKHILLTNTNKNTSRNANTKQI